MVLTWLVEKLSSIPTVSGMLVVGPNSIIPPTATVADESVLSSRSPVALNPSLHGLRWQRGVLIYIIDSEGRLGQEPKGFQRGS